MRKLIALPAISMLALLAACGGGTEAQQTAAPAEVAAAAATINSSEDATAAYADILSAYIENVDGINFFAYGKVTSADQAKLRAYVAYLETSGVEGLSRDEQMAFWYNLYNAKTIEVILENYPVESIRSIGSLVNRGPWDKKNMTVTGFGEMSLNDIEHGTLRANWDEPRIHYAVNCASFGCPNLKATPWTAANLEADMEQAASDYINHPRGFRAENGKITASSIFNWYKVDFGDTDAGVLAHARKYAKGDLKTALDAATKINKFDYNWNLNEQG